MGEREYLNLRLVVLALAMSYVVCVEDLIYLRLFQPSRGKEL